MRLNETEFNEAIEYLEEAIHWDTVLTKPFSLNKDITLYHFSDKKLDILKPIGVNTGNKIARTPRRSIWFTDHKEDWLLPIQAFLKFNHREYWKKELFWKWNKNIALKNSDGTYGTTLILTKEFYKKYKNEVNSFKIYRYTKTFKIKELGRGTEPTVPEWTYDEEVVPDKMDVQTGRDLINRGLIEIVDLETIKTWIEKYDELKKKIGHSMIFPELIDYKVEWWKYDSKTYQEKRKAAEEKMNIPSYSELHLKEAIEYLTESNNQKMYFISDKNMDNETLTPRVPDNYFVKNNYEDGKTPRVCFAPSIDQCLMGLSQNLKGKKFFVHEPITTNLKTKIPTTEEVPDSRITNEIWVLENVKIKCVGEIKVLKDKGLPGRKFKYGNNTAELYDWDWEWINRLTLSELSNICKKINKKVIDNEKDPVGNQNCMICTWCLEAQLRGKDILPRPVYSPTDIIFNKDLFIVKNPTKIKFNSKQELKNIVGENSRYYCHVNWKDSKGGHEFCLINLDGTIYVVDAQDNYIKELDNDKNYFDDINFQNSFLVRLDDKELNEETLKCNDKKYIKEFSEDDKKLLEAIEYLNESTQFKTTTEKRMVRNTDKFLP